MPSGMRSFIAPESTSPGTELSYFVHTVFSAAVADKFFLEYHFTYPNQDDNSILVKNPVEGARALFGILTRTKTAIIA